MKRIRHFPIIPICLVLLLLAFANGQAAPTSTLRIAYIDVGQGDAALIRDSGGFDILIDGGRTSAGPVVVAYLRAQGVDDIDVMVASHADSDHIGGLIDVLEMTDIPVEAVMYSGYPGTTDTWNNFVTAMTNEGLSLTTLQYPSTYNTWGETTAHILNPVAGLVDPETNDASVVIMLEHGDNSFLFTGDIDSGVEADILARGASVVADVLKVAHHGSQYSSSEAFLSAVLPDNAVISVGDNSYGHPADETIARLTAVGAHIWRTDLYGTVFVDSDGFSYSIYSENRRFSLYLPLVTSNSQAAATTGNIQITTVFYNGAGSSETDENVEFRNADSQAIQLEGWTLRDDAQHVYTFPSFVMQPGQICRVYTNEVHPEWCGFNYDSGSAIWNNTGDCAYLRNGQGAVVDNHCY